MSKSDLSAYRILRNHIFDAAKPLVLIIDKANRLESYKGDAAYYGLGNIESGSNCEDHLQFLVGVDNTESMELPFYHCENGKVAHVVLMPHKEQMLILFMDATDAHEQEQELQQKRNEGLIQAERQDRLVKELVKAREELEDKNQAVINANESKARFIADMSHEIRTPITSILGYTNVLKEKFAESEYLKMMEAIERGGRNILTLVENLRDHMHMELSEVKLQYYAVDVNELLEDVLSIFLPIARYKKLELKFSRGRLPQNNIRIDELRVRQLLVNILNNAMKYTEQGSVTMKTSWENQKLFFTITDTGPGIPVSVQNNFLSGTTTNNETGTSSVDLGLAVVRQLVELMDAEIELVSTPGIGTTFKLAIPAEEDQPDFIDDDDSPDDEAEKSHILVIDNNNDTSELYKHVLSQAGFKVTSCPTAGEGIEVAVKLSPQLILIDMNITDMKTPDAIRDLRRKGYTQPVLLQTADSRENSRLVFESGGNGFLNKPIKMTDLIETIQAYLGPIQTGDANRTIRTHLRDHQLQALREKKDYLKKTHLELSKKELSEQDYALLLDDIHQFTVSSTFYGYDALAASAANMEDSIKAILNAGADTKEQKKKIIACLKILYSEIMYCLED